MKKYLIEFMARYSYPTEAVSTITGCYEKVKENGDFTSLLDAFYGEESHQSEYFEKALDAVAEQESVNRYTLYMTYLLCLTKTLQKKYEKEGIDEQVRYDTLEDLKFKLLECIEVEKAWGISPFSWFYGLFHMRIFSLGRMEYNYGPFRGESATVAGVEIKDGDMVLHVHIPSSGRPFDTQARLDSYHRAYLFYRDKLGGKNPVFCCDSWLLNPENKKVLGEQSNISSFVDDFKIINQYVYPDKRNLWRIFGGAAELPPDKLPRDTSLRRKIADWLEEGNRLGGGKGLFVYDPVNKKIMK